jgi:hypothetical protein
MSSVIVLTKNWAFWGERSLKDIMRLYFKGKIEVVKADEAKVIHSGISREGVTLKIPMPLIVRLLGFAGYKIKSETINCTDEKIYHRDENICQYMHTDEYGKHYKYRCSVEDRSIDHVIPLSRGGKDKDFLNEVCCCEPCNNIKGNKTPEEAHMKLLRKPFIPKSRKGDWAIITFTFNPQNKAHKAFCDLMNIVSSGQIA